MNLTTAFFAAVKDHGAKIALYWGESTYSYDDLWSRSLGAASILKQSFKVKRGDRVGLWLKNCPEFIPCFFGVLRAAAVVVPINNFLKPEEVAFILNDGEIDVLITDQEGARHMRDLQAARPHLRSLTVEQLPPQGMPGDFPEPAATDLAVIIYTSGTTGHPKGAMLSHANLLCNVESCRISLKTVAADRIAVLLPLFHSYMLTVGILLPLTTGGSMVLVKSLHPPRAVLQEIFSKEATILPAIPQFYRSLTHAPITGPLPLRICISGAAPLPGVVLQEFEAKFKVPLIEGYGLSEASPVVTKNPLDGTHKPGSIGIPIPGVEVTIQDDSGQLLPDFQVGEVCVRGGNVMLGYWKQPEETAQAFRNGWLLTGDVGYRDSDGYFYITDRKKDMLLVNGMNVYPREIEEVIYRFPGVKEAAVIGKPDPRKGEHPVAFVCPTEGASIDPKALIHFLRQHLADYKIPRHVVTLPGLPRNATGKILKTSLRQAQIDG